MTLSISDVRAIGDMFHQHNYDLVIPAVPGGGNGDALRIHLANTVVPGFSNEFVEKAVQGHITKHAGIGRYPMALPIEFYENSQMLVLNTLRAWRDLQWDPQTGAQQPESVYKTTAYLQLLANDKSIAKTITIEGVAVEDVADAPLDGSSSEIVRYSATLSYDRWE